MVSIRYLQQFSTGFSNLSGVALSFLLVQMVMMTAVASAAETTSKLQTVAATKLTLSREFRLDGEVEAINKATVSAQTAGSIKSILVDVDDYVEKGAIIIHLKDISQQANLRKADAGKKEAESNLAKAEDEFSRIKDVYEKKVVSKAQFDEAKHNLSAARARLDAATASLAEAREQLSYTQVRAPYSGIVTQRHVEVGEAVQPGKQLMTGVSLDKLRVNVDVPQSLISKIRQYNKAFVYVNKAPAIPYIKSQTQVEVEKITVFPIADHTSNTFKVRLDLPEGIEGLFPGMFVKTSLVTGEKEELIVPTKSVVHRSEVTAVYVLNDDGAINFRHISLGRVQGDMQVVLSGIDAGEAVATDPIKAGIQAIAQRRAIAAGQ